MLLIKLSLVICLVLTASCTIPVIQDPIPLPIPVEPTYPKINTELTKTANGDWLVPTPVMVEIIRKIQMQSAYIGQCRAVLESTH